MLIFFLWIILDYKTWIVSDLVERSPDEITVGLWVKNVFYEDCEFLFFCPDSTESLNFNLNWYSAIPAIELNLAGYRSVIAPFRVSLRPTVVSLRRAIWPFHFGFVAFSVCLTN